MRRTGGTAKMESIEPGVCCAGAVRKASRRITQLYDAALAPCGLRSTQFAILNEVARRHGLEPTMAELAAALVMDRSSLGHNLRPLERDGLLTFEADDKDRRRRCVRLTAEGRRRLGQAIVLWQQAQDRFHAVFGSAAAAELRSTLLAIANNDALAALA